MGDVGAGSGAGILVVTGLRAEGAIAKAPGCRVISGGGVADQLEEKIREKLRDGVSGIISFGIAGGLSARLSAGAVILADSIIAGSERYMADETWLRLLSARLPGATIAPLLGVGEPAAESSQKAQLFAESGAVAVDMESHIAARLAAAYGLPFAALRVVSDTAHRSLPDAARSAMRSDGGIDITAVLRSLIRQPRQLPELAAIARESGLAFTALRKSRRALDGTFCFPYT